MPTGIPKLARFHLYDAGAKRVKDAMRPKRMTREQVREAENDQALYHF